MLPSSHALSAKINKSANLSVRIATKRLHISHKSSKVEVRFSQQDDVITSSNSTKAQLHLEQCERGPVRELEGGVIVRRHGMEEMGQVQVRLESVEGRMTRTNRINFQTRPVYLSLQTWKTFCKVLFE